MSGFVIAIPSYRRAGKQETAEYLSGLGYPRERIYIFVQTEDDMEAYRQHSDIAQIIFEPANGIAQARNNIMRRLNGQADILMMDDDVSAISRLRKGKLVKIDTLEEFEKTIGTCFNYTRKNFSRIFGIYPVYNEFFMSQDISTKVTVNTVLGFTKRSGLMFDESYTAKEDIELCARVLNKGEKVMRYNFLALKAKHRTNAGGCFDIWHSNEHRETVARLCKAYPDVLAPNTRKPNEVRVIMKDEKIPIKRGHKAK